MAAHTLAGDSISHHVLLALHEGTNSLQHLICLKYSALPAALPASKLSCHFSLAIISTSVDLLVLSFQAS